jgi:hypothetical protein
MEPTDLAAAAGSRSAGRHRGMAKVKTKLITVTRRPGGRWVLVGIALAALLFPVAICSAAVLLVGSTTTFFDTTTTIETARGWRYSVSEAHVKTSPQLRDRGPARPGYRYLYFDVTVQNLLDDREAPGIDFHFARVSGALGERCGSEGTYVPGVVAGWCLSDNDNFFTGGASCSETSDRVFHTVDTIPPGGRAQVRCVDSHDVPDDFDLGTIRVYYTGTSVMSSGTDYPNLTEIPTRT